MFYQPHTLDEALRLKRSLGPEVAFLAGGTDVIVQMNHGKLPAKAFIDLTHVPDFGKVDSADSPDGPTALIDGATTYSRLAKLPIACLAQASLSIGGPQIRNRGTIAGNLASASPAGDGSVALLALDAGVHLRNQDGERQIPLRDFFLDYRKTALAPDEIIYKVSVPANWRSAWHKLGKRGAMNISMVCCAAGVSPAGKFHVAFGSVGPYPLRVPETEAYLTANAGKQDPDSPLKIPDSVINEAVRMASMEVKPIDDFRASAAYRSAMAGALLKKVLRGLCGLREPVRFNG